MPLACLPQSETAYDCALLPSGTRFISKVLLALERTAAIRGSQRLLLEGDKPVRLGSRAFDILIALIERAGEVVSTTRAITPGITAHCSSALNGKYRRGWLANGWPITPGKSTIRARRSTSPGARWRARAWRPVLGVARGDEPCALAAQSRPARRRRLAPSADLRSFHRGFQYCRSYRGETATGQPRRCWTSLRSAPVSGQSPRSRGNLIPGAEVSDSCCAPPSWPCARDLGHFGTATGWPAQVSPPSV